LLLDLWPLGRTTSGPPPEVPAPARGRLPWPRLVLEKLPLLALAIGSSAVTVVAQSRGESVTGLELGLGARVGNAAVSYLHYVRDTVWPSGLCVFYPHPRGGLGAGIAVLSTAIVLVVTAALLWRARRLPAVAVGWCWFVGTLVPVIGLVQVGAQARADRYTYLPSLGLFLAAAWGGHALAARWRAAGIAAGAAAAALVVLSVVTFRQLGHWESHESLFRHAVEVSPENAHVRAILSKELRRQRRLDESLELAQASVRLDAGDARYWNNLALSARALGRVEEARWALVRAGALDPRELGTWFNLGRLETDAGNLLAAEAAFRQATVAAPESPVAWKLLGTFLAGTGRLPEAVAAFGRAVELAPGDREALFQLGSVQVAAGLREDARATAARLGPLAPELARELGARVERAPGR
jgi:Flp pilus assembly protein TadD